MSIQLSSSYLAMAPRGDIKGSKVIKWVTVFKTEKVLEIQAKLTEACGKV